MKYRTSREIKLKNNVAVNISVLALNVQPTKQGEKQASPIFTRMIVESLDDNSLQPTYIEVDDTLYKILTDAYPKGIIGQSLMIMRLPKISGGKPYRYEVAELKVGK